MKATELMIGDWVQLVKRKDKTAKVTAIYPNCIDTNIVYPLLEDEIDPIPLTPEILEKNGFRWTGSGDSTGMLSTPWGFDGIRYNIYVGLKKKTIEVYSAHPELRTDSWRKVNKVSLEVCGCFVHELQHALKLCGIEKEIEL